MAFDFNGDDDDDMDIDVRSSVDSNYTLDIEDTSNKKLPTVSISNVKNVDGIENKM